MDQGQKVGTDILNKDNARAVWRYATRPDILPRIRKLGLHFGHFAYLIALVLHSARLVPTAHPALNSAHIGRFSVREVLALAGGNIRWSWRNTDQIAIYGAVIAGIIMIFVQAVLIAVLAVFGQAQASDATSFFETPAEYVTTDVALIFLEQVLGPNLDFFGTASQPLGTPVYEGIHAILSLYSLAMMVIAVIIVVYYIMTVVGEAAKSGTPFGQRFNSLWAPIRLVVALGLLVPLGSGLNSAQYLTLWLAKMGSGLGTQVWSVFVEEITAATDIVSKPTGESTSALVQRIFLNEVCAASYNQIEETSSNSIKILQVTGRRSSVVPDFANPSNMVTAAREAGQEAVVLSWSLAEPGERATDYACGRISVSLSEFNAFSDGENVSIAEERWWWSVPFIGPDMDERLGTIHENVKSAYLREIKAISDAVRPSAEAIAAVKISVNRKPEFGDESTLDDAPTADGATGVADILRTVGQSTQDNINTTIQATYESITGSEYVSTGGYEEMQRRGWGAAGLWYGTLGTINKKYMDAIASAVPTLDTLFEATEVQENERGALGWLFGISRFDLSGGATSEIEQTITYASDAFAGVVRDIAPGTSPLYEDARYIEADAAGEGGWFGKALVTMMGGRQVLSVKNDPDLDPMVRLAATGHNMITGSLWAAGFGTAFGIGGAIAATLPSPIAKFGGEAIGAIAVLLFVFAGIALTAGIFLAYVLPLIPFVYFAFAVIGWILEIFEAIVAMPLWALAHLRIDGDGMPGQAAIGGYQLLLMILLRPALIVMGLVGGYVIFGAAVYYFSILYNSATAITQSDIAANTSIGGLGTFIYTIIFVFLVYNIALMCFKMIDDVPKGILRWMGAGISTFGDSRGDPINGAREVVTAGAAAAIGGARGLQSSAQGLQKANMRRQQRNKGIDPDDPVQKVEIIGGPGGPPPGPGGGGTP